MSRRRKVLVDRSIRLKLTMYHDGSYVVVVDGKQALYGNQSDNPIADLRKGLTRLKKKFVPGFRCSEDEEDEE